MNSFKRLLYKEELTNLKVQNRRKEKNKKELIDVKWIIKILLLTFTITFILSFISELIIPNLSLLFGCLLTLLFIFVGVLFDLIGVAVTSANEKVFHSMNSRKVLGAKVAVLFKKNADKVASFCCDVIGDICGVISGAAAATIAIILNVDYGINALISSLLIASIVASLTVGGKAIGKSFAINKSDIILFKFAKIVSNFYKG